MITGPGEAATTRTSTPKSLSFFSISRRVISSESGVTLSRRPGAASSRSTCGSLASLNSLNSGCCRSLATRSDLGTSATGFSMTMGTWSSITSLLVRHHLVALELGLLAQADVLGAFERSSRRSRKRVDAGADRFGQREP